MVASPPWGDLWAKREVRNPVMAHVGKERSRYREQRVPMPEMGWSLVGAQESKDSGTTGAEYSRTPGAFVKRRGFYSKIWNHQRILAPVLTRSFRRKRQKQVDQLRGQGSTARDNGGDLDQGSGPELGRSETVAVFWKLRLMSEMRERGDTRISMNLVKGGIFF